MKFKIDNTFLAFCGSMNCGKPCEVISKELADRFIKAGMLKDSPHQEYGLQFIEACEPAYVGEICRVLIDYFCVPEISENEYTTFLYCVILGDGDCPYCGGHMVLVDEEGHTEYSWRNEFPPEWITEKQIFRCDVCDYEKILTF